MYTYLPNEPTSQALQYFVNKIYAENTVFPKTLKRRKNMHSYQLIFYIDASRIKFYKRSFIIYENTENIGIGRFEKYTYIRISSNLSDQPIPKKVFICVYRYRPI